MTSTGGGDRSKRDGAPGARRPMPPSIQPKQPSSSGSGPRRVHAYPPGRDAVDETRVMPPQKGPQQQGGRPPQPAGRPAPRPPQRPAGGQGARPAAPRPRRRRRHRCCTAAFVLILLVAIPVIGFMLWAQGQIQTVPALSAAPDTPGRTYLIVGSDSREGLDTGDPTEGARTDTIMLLHQPESGPTALISIPRDSYVEIPGYSANKVNAAFAFGGPELLVETVENLSGLTIDGYLEVGFMGVADMVDAVDGVELCYDQDVSDELSQLEWEAGCHLSDGETALAFSRMRYSDPLGDIGRAQRQRQVVGAVAEEVLSPSTLLNPFQLVPVTSAALGAFTFNDDTGVIDIGRMAWVLRSGLGGEAVTGTPPIADMGYGVDGVGSTVLLDPDLVDQFWDDIAQGAYPPGATVGGVE
ncbi:LCP family protein [Demequina activiva]|uniref:Cell envelope-related transcriptional attenuator domain-containing protein n=1 Tax=Demequina activiva TaxID=1582364 RepID=A0A919Q7E4_9MICO|nr:LCP family protein [Demequina activiva]GIG55548.1 hypothetical protein Dac01nite_23000 [Demequina activiva]